MWTPRWCTDTVRTASKADMYRGNFFSAKKGRQMLAKVEFLKINRFSECYGS